MLSFFHPFFVCFLHFQLEFISGTSGASLHGVGPSFINGNFAVPGPSRKRKRKQDAPQMVFTSNEDGTQTQKPAAENNANSHQKQQRNDKEKELVLCEECGLGFSRTDKLAQHQRRFHPEVKPKGFQ